MSGIYTARRKDRVGRGLLRVRDHHCARSHADRPAEVGQEAEAPRASEGGGVTDTERFDLFDAHKEAFDFELTPDLQWALYDYPQPEGVRRLLGTYKSLREVADAMEAQLSSPIPSSSARDRDRGH